MRRANSPVCPYRRVAASCSLSRSASASLENASLEQRPIESARSIRFCFLLRGGIDADLASGNAERFRIVGIGTVDSGDRAKISGRAHREIKRRLRAAPSGSGPRRIARAHRTQSIPGSSATKQRETKERGAEERESGTSDRNAAASSSSPASFQTFSRVKVKPRGQYR